MLDQIAERKIAEAIERGELEDLRMAYRILKNAGAKKLALLKAQIEQRYYDKVLAKLGKRASVSPRTR